MSADIFASACEKCEPRPPSPRYSGGNRAAVGGRAGERGERRRAAGTGQFAYLRGSANCAVFDVERTSPLSPALSPQTDAGRGRTAVEYLGRLPLGMTLVVVFFAHLALVAAPA